MEQQLRISIGSLPLVTAGFRPYHRVLGTGTANNQQSYIIRRIRTLQSSSTRQLLRFIVQLGIILRMFAQSEVYKAARPFLWFTSKSHTHRSSLPSLQQRLYSAPLFFGSSILSHLQHSLVLVFPARHLASSAQSSLLRFVCDQTSTFYSRNLSTRETLAFALPERFKSHSPQQCASTGESIPFRADAPISRQRELLVPELPARPSHSPVSGQEPVTNAASELSNKAMWPGHGHALVLARASHGLHGSDETALWHKMTPGEDHLPNGEGLAGVNAISNIFCTPFHIVRWTVAVRGLRGRHSQEDPALGERWKHTPLSRQRLRFPVSSSSFVSLGG
ncbi:hypothetical protein B0I35DRAFT_428950 [Stachybotrys elegans]|uniref:Uncharacterized protein n=1 Tax=Stachybotrys elegans TaxID=80388 RepID=A0A8K0SSN7_9HYPO|nr:hypothetical protein B0I35DRAFT_428950 [Stachybotrys elegans]